MISTRAFWGFHIEICKSFVNENNDDVKRKTEIFAENTAISY